MGEPTLIGTDLPPVIRRKIESGQVEVPDAPYEGRETDEEAEARRQAVRDQRAALWRRRLPLRYAAASLTDLTEEQGGDRVRAWWPSTHLTLLLHSAAPGVGKTHAAYAVGNEVVATGGWAESWTAIGLLGDLRPGGPEGTMDHVLGCEVLVLDDLGRESDSNWTREQVHHVISTRLAEGKRQVITTNLTGEQWETRYSAPLVDRLIDDAVVIAVQGRSRRREAPW